MMNSLVIIQYLSATIGTKENVDGYKKVKLNIK